MYLTTVRFNENTWAENEEYRRINNIKGCIYGSPKELSTEIMYYDKVLVIEMNNTYDIIEGVGLIINHPYFDKYYEIHKDQNLNRYIYKSRVRIDRENMINYHDKLLNILEYIVFSEKNHLKRGIGIMRINQSYINQKQHKQIKKIVLKKLINVVQKCLNNTINNI